ncbi:MAG: NAD-dependent deacetylase [Pelotomaculum sp.]|nr:NAD-dependent deacetylase [Pelotomaculum sp.]
MEDWEKFKKVAEAIKNAKAVVITAGAGMGVDSGLPDFRGDKGFWKAYPLYERLGISFVEAANPAHFAFDPAFGWGFYGHRASLYRETAPHAGFQILLDWIDKFGLDYFVATSNVDGHFQKAGFSGEKIYEVHGSIHYLQCLTPCSEEIWENNESIPVDHSTMRAKYIPKCPRCGAAARPNILMFGDFSWLSGRTDRQGARFRDFLHRHREDRMAVIEIGAGTAVPTIRRLSEHLGSRRGATVIRINPREPQIGFPHLSLACGALEGLRGIDSFLEGKT